MPRITRARLHIAPQAREHSMTQPDAMRVSGTELSERTSACHMVSLHDIHSDLSSSARTAERMMSLTLSRNICGFAAEPRRHRCGVPHPAPVSYTHLTLP